MQYRLWNALVASASNAINNSFYNLLFLVVDLLYRWALGNAPALWADVLRATNLAGTYANGSAGVGATLTKSSAGAFATEDGVTPYLGMLVVLTGQTARAENGLYKLTRLGDASTAWQLTRFSGWDQSAEMITGSIFYIRKGTTYGGSVYAYTGASSPTVGTTGLTFAQDSLIRTFSAALSGSSWTPVRVLTAAALPANTYAVATQTKTANANGTLTVDGVLLAAGDRFWDKDAGTGSERGLFEVTDAGSGGTPWKAARAADANASSDFVDGKTFTVREGTQAHTAWQFTTNAPFVLDTDTPAIARETNVMRTDEAQTVTAIKRFNTLMLAVFNGAGTFLSKFASNATADRTFTLPDYDGTAATLAGTETLENKTLTAPTIADFTNAAHDHGDADDGGNLPAASVTGTAIVGAQIRRIDLTPAAEAGNAIVVSGQIVDRNGNNVAAQINVVVETLAPTAAKGQITVTGGVEIMNTGAPAGKLSTAVVQTDAGGAFAVSIADDQVETVLVRCTNDIGLASQALLSFA